MIYSLPFRSETITYTYAYLMIMKFKLSQPIDKDLCNQSTYHPYNVQLLDEVIVNTDPQSWIIIFAKRTNKTEPSTSCNAVSKGPAPEEGSYLHKCNMNGVNTPAKVAMAIFAKEDKKTINTYCHLHRLAKLVAPFLGHK